METKDDLRARIKELEAELDNQKIAFTKKELQEFIAQEVKSKLEVEVKEHESYQYGGGYKTLKSIGTFYAGDMIYESTSFE